MNSEVDRLAAQIEQLQGQLAQLSSQLAQVQPLAKDITSPYGNVVIHEKRVHTYGANLAEPRRLIDYWAKNTTTNANISIKDYSAGQIERAARKFARLDTPTRKLWHGDKFLYGYVLKLFAQRGGIIRHHGSRMWRWAAWPHQRREIAAMIIASLSRPT